MDCPRCDYAYEDEDVFVYEHAHIAETGMCTACDFQDYLETRLTELRKEDDRNDETTAGS